MSDGNTGIQVAPITEDEAMRVQDILKRGLDAIMQASQLAADVASLREQVAKLASETDRLQRHNESLEEALSSARQRRRELEDKLTNAEDRAFAAESKQAEANTRADDLARLLDTKTFEWNAAEQQRDEAQLRNMELEDKLKDAEDKLEQIKEGYANIFGQAPAEPPRHEPPKPEPYEPPVYPSQPAEPVTTRRYVDYFEPGALWDNDKFKYYVEDQG